MSLLSMICLVSFMVTFISIIFIPLVKNVRNMKEGKQVNGYLPSHHSNYEYYLESMKLSRKWAFVIFVVSGLLLIIVETINRS